jgi:hypothetical protein
LQNAGVWGFSRGACGVAGYSDDYVGVSGESKGGPGVAALSQASYGVLAQSSTFYGVFAGSGTNSGVVGTTALTQQVALIPNAAGVFSTAGILGVAGAQGPQVWQGPNVGKNINPPIAGVYGTSDLGPGVIGTSKAAIGIYGFSSGNAGVVRELAGGTSSAAFSYRIVARRKDVKGHRRFAKIDTRLPIPPARPARRRGAKMPPSTPAGLRAFAARMEKAARAQMRKRGRKGGRS